MECSIDDKREGCTCTYEPCERKGRIAQQKPREKMTKSIIERTAERGS